MKKTIIMMATLFTMAFVSCKKEGQEFLTPIATVKVVPTLKINSSFPNVTFVGAKTDTVIASMTFNPNDAQGLYPMASSIKFLYSGAFKPSTGYKNMYYTVKGPGNFYFKSETIATVLDGDNSFNQWFRNLGSNLNYLIEVHAEVTTAATDGLPPDDQCAAIFSITYQSDGIVQNKTVTDTAQVLTFSLTPPPFAVVSIADPSTPISGVVLQGQEKEVFRYAVKLTGFSGNVTEHRLLVQGPAAGAITALKLYDGNNNFIAQANVSGGIVTIFTNDVISVGMQKVYNVKPVVNVTSGDVSNNDFTIILDAVKALSSVTGEPKTDLTDRVANPFTVLKAILDIKKVAVPTLTITNNTVMDLFTIDLTAINGDVSLKELAYAISLDDQSNNDTLFLKSFQVLDENGNDLTAQFRFTDALSIQDTLFSESDTKLRSTRIAGTGETVIPAGTTKRLRFRAFVGGFNHPLDGDGFSVVPASDTNASTGLKYLNTGGLSLGNIKLYSNPAGNASAQNFNWVWSDKSSPNHSGQPSPNSLSNDWLNGNGFISMLVNNFHQ